MGAAFSLNQMTIYPIGDVTVFACVVLLNKIAPLQGS